MQSAARSVVALVRCETYERETVRAAFRRGIDLLGGVALFAAPGERILLKPNLLLGRAPNRAVTTHPSVFRAAAETLLEAGAVVTYGDSPGFGRMAAVARRAGIAEVADELGVAEADFATGRSVPFPSGHLIKQFTLACGALDADGIVSLPKLKTHGLTRMTGAIKNQFGCVPGLLKGEFHARLANVDAFSRMLVDLNRYLAPRLFVLDAVVAMEGNGPQGGAPRAMELLAFSRDPVALDATACRLIDLDPALVPPISYGERLGLGSASDLEFLGDPLESFLAADFAVDRRPRSTTDRPGRPSRLARRLVVPKPVIRFERCTRCGTCVSVCPVDPKAVQFRSSERLTPPEHHYERCIRCYCCHEMCPEGAIEIVTPPLGRLLHR